MNKNDENNNNNGLPQSNKCEAVVLYVKTSFSGSLSPVSSLLSSLTPQKKCKKLDAAVRTSGPGFPNG
jgi:hypothetical protein